MLHLLYINPLKQDIIPISMYKSREIEIRKTENINDVFYLAFKNFSYKSKDNFVFSIYKDYKNIKRHTGQQEKYVDKDKIYLFEDKSKGAYIDYAFLYMFWYLAKNYPNTYTLHYDKITKDEYMLLNLDYFYKKVMNNNYSLKDLNEIIKAINEVNFQFTEYSIDKLPKVILDEIGG